MSTDILWHNSSTNETQIWFMNKHKVTGRATVVDENGSPIFVGPPWSIVGTHEREIVWHNSSSNETQIWFMDGHRVTGRATVVDENDRPIFSWAAMEHRWNERVLTRSSATAPGCAPLEHFYLLDF